MGEVPLYTCPAFLVAPPTPLPHGDLFYVQYTAPTYTWSMT